MLPKKNRADKKSIENIFKIGRYLTSPSFTFKFIKDNKLKNSQIAFIVPKTITKSAVRRNFLKRLGFSSITTIFSELPKNIIGAFIFNKNASKLFLTPKKDRKISINELKNEIQNTFSKIN